MKKENMQKCNALKTMPCKFVKIDQINLITNKVYAKNTGYNIFEFLITIFFQIIKKKQSILFAINHIFAYLYGLF